MKEEVEQSKEGKKKTSFSLYFSKTNSGGVWEPPQPYNITMWVINRFYWNGAMVQDGTLKLVQSSYARKEWTGIPLSFCLPFKAVNSMMTRHPSTIPPAFCTSSDAALREPPVASKSSTIRILWSFFIAPHWSSKMSLPYSRMYSTLCVSPGNLFLFLTATHPIDSSEAIVKLNRNPRASSPTTASIDGWFSFT